jgi:uncharacterized protein (DUF2147 family)
VSGLDNLAAGGDGGIRTLETPFEVCSFSKRVPSASRPRLPSDGRFAADALAKRCICPTPKGLASILALTWFDEPIFVLLLPYIALTRVGAAMRLSPFKAVARQRCAYTLGLTLFAATLNTSAIADEPYGNWLTSDRDSELKLSKCGSNLCGHLTWMSEPNDDDGSPKRDIYNPDPAQRGRLVIGIAILLGLSLEGDHWVGKIYNPQDGKTYQATFRLIDAKRAELQGCAAVIFCQTQIWTRD